MRARILVLGFLAVSASPQNSRAASLDVTSFYRMRALSYTNLNLDTNNKNSHSFIANDAKLGFAVQKIALETRGPDETTMDVAILLHALGVSGSTTALSSAPFDRIANNYPSSNFTPFLENAYLRVHYLFGLPLEATFGRQSYKLGSGLVLDDDGAGFTGVSLRGQLPWWEMKLEGFIFNDKNAMSGSPNTLDLAGLTLALPTDGIWQLNELVERDRSVQTVFGCSTGNPDSPNCLVSKAVRSFSSLRYQISYGPMVFDGEAALEKGSATPAGPTPAPNHITYNGNAQVVRAKWKQNLYKTGEGIARISLARASGDKPGTSATDEAFFPSHGHRFNGLERSGFGDFFGASPYDAFGGNYSTTTASGLKPGTSGIVIVGAGFTPPAYKGIALDMDYFLFQADRVATGSGTLGSEWDFRLRYSILDRFTLSASAALFSIGTASNPAKGSARKYGFEASGRF